MLTSSTTTVARLSENDLQNLDRRLNRSLAARKSHIQRQIIEEADECYFSSPEQEGGIKPTIISHEGKKRRGLGSPSFGGMDEIVQSETAHDEDARGPSLYPFSPGRTESRGFLFDIDRERGTSRAFVFQTTKKAPILTSLEQTVDEIKACAKTGVTIAHQAESHPLIPLYRAAKIALPPQLKVDHENLKYDFYAVEVTFSILLPEDQFPLSAQLNLTLVDDATELARRTRPIRLFPARIDIRYFKADLVGKFGIDANMSFSTPQLNIPVNPSIQATTQASAAAEVKAAFVFGPLIYTFRKAALDVIGESDQQIIWRYNLKSQLTGTNEFKSILILKIASEVHSVVIDASLSVVPAKRHWLLFRNILPALPARASLPVELDPHP
ncbi:MAG TPA: hypothetical protein VGF67_26090 [Ktedonobacteraceae bacterium]|jgi:hypothetical protein